MLLLLQFCLDFDDTSQDSSAGHPLLGLCFISRLIQIFRIYRTLNLGIFCIAVNGVALSKCFFSYRIGWIWLKLHRTLRLDPLPWGCALLLQVSYLPEVIKSPGVRPSVHLSVCPSVRLLNFYFKLLLLLQVSSDRYETSHE